MFKKTQQSEIMDKTMTSTNAPDRIEFALYEPDIAPNVGTMMRLSACLNIAVHVIEPCGFPFSRRVLKRTLMDYEPYVDLHHHADWSAFHKDQMERGRRLVLTTTKGSTAFNTVRFSSTDTLIMGSESSGVPDKVHSASDVRIRIPMRAEVRSINVATAASMILGEALRQTCGFDTLV